MRHPVEHGRQAFLQACRLDVQVRKPGNVSLASPGHGMQAAQFIASAEAAQHALFERGLPVGQRIEGAVAASVEVAGCNTNLGIVLLCAPIAAALDRWQPHAGTEALRAAVQDELAALTVSDAAAAYRAIACANPGGLGRAPEQDVAHPPSIDLRSAMALAAGRDSIARQYANGFADLFDTGLPACLAYPALGTTAAVQRTFLAFMAGWPDSHIVRKLGDAAAHSVMRQAQPWHERAAHGEPLDGDAAFAAWDEALKAAGINPGTSADLTVASLLLAAVATERPLGRDEPAPPSSWHGK